LTYPPSICPTVEHMPNGAERNKRLGASADERFSSIVTHFIKNE
jgi:hypothetical protein